MTRSRFMTRKIFYRLYVGFLLASLTVSATTLADTLFISRYLGDSATAAMSLLCPYSYLTGFLEAVTVGGVAVVGTRLLGKMQLEDARKAYSVTGSWITVFSLLFAALTCVLIGPLTDLLCGAAEESVKTAFRSYLLVYAWGSPAVLMNSFLLPVLQLDGDSPRCRIAVAVTAVTDIAGDWLCIAVLGWGMAGMALTTVVSLYLGTAVMGTHFIGGRAQLKLSFRLNDPKLLGRICLSGLPGTVTFIACLAFQLPYNRLFQQYGVAATAALSIFYSIRTPLVLVSIPVTQVVTAVMGIYQGEEDAEGIRDFNRTFLIFAAVIVNLVALAAFLAAPALTALYGSGESAEQAAFLIRCYATGMFFQSFIFFARGYLPAIREFAMGAVYAVLAETVCPLLPAVLMSSRMGFRGLGYAQPVGYFLFFVLLAAGIPLYRFIRPGRQLLRFSGSDFGLTEGGPEAAVHSVEEAVAFSREAYDFIRPRAGVRKAYRISLAVEELGVNLFDHAEKTGAKTPHAEMRVRIRGDQAILSVRDTGSLFNPKAWNEKAGGTGADKGMGIRLALTDADVEYVNTFHLNMLVIRL